MNNVISLRIDGLSAHSLIPLLLLLLGGCSLIGGGDGSATGNVDSRNAAVMKITELEAQLARETNRAALAEQELKRGRVEADWLAQLAQEEPVLRTRIIELEQEIARLSADSQRIGLLEANLRDLEVENDRLSRALRGDWSEASTGQPSGAQPDIPASEPLSNVADYGEGNYAVHLASYRSREDALDGWQHLRRRYPSLLEGLQGHFGMFDVPSLGGRYFRLTAGPFDGAAGAQGLCRSLTAAGQYCMIATFDGELLRE